MPRPKNAMEIFKLLDKSNCRECGEKTCLAFAGAVYQGRKKIHINPWVAIPFLDYLRYGKGLPVSGNWLSFRELKDGKERYPLFQKRCEAPMKQVADTNTDLFDDLVRIFGGKQVEKQFESDISVVLHPLPRVPIMICYWLPEDGLESSLNVFFDDTADKNLAIGSVFSLGAGLSQMFEKLALRHGFPARGGVDT